MISITAQVTTEGLERLGTLQVPPDKMGQILDAGEQVVRGALEAAMQASPMPYSESGPPYIAVKRIEKTRAGNMVVEFVGIDADKWYLYVREYGQKRGGRVRRIRQDGMRRRVHVGAGVTDIPGKPTLVPAVPGAMEQAKAAMESVARGVIDAICRELEIS